MCSDLFRIPIEVSGVPIFGVGVVLSVWLVVGGFATWRSVRSHGWSGETASTFVLLVGVSVAIVLLPRMFPEGLPIRGFGMMVLAGSLAGVALASYRAEQVGISRDVILSLTIWLFVCGIIGARAFYVVEYWEEGFADPNWLVTVGNVLSFPAGGLVIYGALIGGLAAFVWFVRRHRLPALAVADVVAPSIMLGLALGRVGCLLNGCCYGTVSNLPWAVTFPQYSAADRFSGPYESQVRLGDMYGFRLAADELGRPRVVRVDEGTRADEAQVEVGDIVREINGQEVQRLQDAENAIWSSFWGERTLVLVTNAGTHELPTAAVSPRSLPVHPTQVYSAINAALICWLLWEYYPFRRRDGEVMALMLTIYPISRFLLEMIRTDESAIFGTGLSISQNVSIVILIAMVFGWIILRRLPPRIALGGGAGTVAT